MRNSRIPNLVFVMVFVASAIASSAGTLIDVAFTGTGTTAKTGFAAVGVNNDDFWNACQEAVSNLLFVDGVTPSGAQVTITNGANQYGNGASDPMYGIYLYAYSGNIVVTITNLAAGTYNFYVYGHGNQNFYAGVYQLSVDSQSYGTEETTNGPGWLSTVWQEGVQYVEFTNVIVAVGQTITINAEPTGAPYWGSMAEISGLQLAYDSATPPPGPIIVLAPESQVVVACSNATFGVFANGAAPLAYQWQFDTTNIAGATNTSYSVENAQPTNDGNYSVIVSNAYGSVTSAVAALTVNGTPFIAAQPANLTVAPGSTANFTFSAGGATPLQYAWKANGINIPRATNNSYSVVDAESSNSANYSVIVSNAYGTATSGVAALNVIAPVASVIDVAFGTSSPATKIGFAATGVTSNDFWNAYVMNTESLPSLEFTDGTVSGADLTVENAGGAYGNGSSDPMYGMYLFPYESGNITVTINNLRGGMYDFYLYGHGNVDDQNGIYDLVAGSQDYGTEATIDGSGWLSLVWAEGLQYVEFTNVNVSPGQAVTITVEAGATRYAIISGLQMAPVGPRSPNAYIVIGPTNQIVAHGSNTEFSVLAAGAIALTYQWQFDNANIAGATNSSYSVTNAQPANGGSYSVIVGNMYGTVTSVVATLTVFELTGSLIDVAFTSNSVTPKMGFATTGVTANDFWNTYPGAVSALELGGTLSNLIFANGTFSDAGLSVFMPDGPAFSTNGASDSMYGVFLYAYSDAGNLTLQVTHLSPGIYNLYLYGHGPSNNLNSIFRLTAGSLSYGSEATTNGPGWLSSVWQEGVQYVEFTNVVVLPSQTITITVQAGNFEYYAVLSGLQIAYLGTPQVTGVASNGDGSVTLNFVGLPNTSARVWAATNLAPPILWVPIFTNQNVGASGDWQFTDTNTASYNERFYRFSIP